MTKKQDIPPGDHYRIRCPRLGHQISFSYCRWENGDLPCFKTLDCWHEHFPVEAFLRKELTPEQWEKAFGKPRKSKIASLVDLIEQARTLKREDS